MRAYRWVMHGSGQAMTKVAMDTGGTAPGEVLVAVSGCGVCHTDIDYFYNGVRTSHPLPLALGHEIAGRVEAAGPGAEEWLGKAVLVPAVVPCGECDLCRRGKGTICRAQKMPGNHIHGGFATHVRVPAAGLCAVDEDRLAAIGLGLADLAVVADAVTSPYQAAVRADVGPGDLVVVIGVGGIGTFAIQIANALCAEVIALSHSAAKLEQVAHDAATLNLDHYRTSREIKQAIVAFAQDKGLRPTEWIIMECSGNTASQELAFDLLVPGATLCVVGYNIEKGHFRLANLMAHDARALGSWGCPPELYPGALDLVLSGKIRVADFIERRPLDTINETFAEVRDHRLTRRVVLTPAG
ncbi:6-hydroxycyclohex-1-ene-1-carbonyl-CoA dehydrogenase [Aromatoleum evansii]|uniref:6-hydroxycyclohex-1-ene-1-carbonyl-CoA dehydrogenase n=1 Tax=Aromatoleum evansii TaxID=59406 RepID=UPI00145EE617|nr:6-hydroxycyclohex-1-ene-1-carbonyl-CoA dehydrogenase [Aromatoleum evansii]NMG30033.1 6-hydroxycyclohex-1-ene-1-carbonyl-CoA dehydrogenase [Aromatoleum evansii]